MPHPRRNPSAARTAGIVGYVRVSTEEQAMSGLGLEAQELAIRANAKRRDLPVLAIYRDEGLSARTLERPRTVRGARVFATRRGRRTHGRQA